MTRKYNTKVEIFASKVEAAKKAETVALELMGRNSPCAKDIWAMANELWAKANAYSIRWNLRAI